MLKIHTDDNVANLLTKAFDGPMIDRYLFVIYGVLGDYGSNGDMNF